MNYARIRVMTGGTFTTGASTNWSSQFYGAQSWPQFTYAGEISVEAATYGVCADICVQYDQATVCPVYLEASVGAPAQVVIDGKIFVEATAAGIQSLEMPEGTYPVAFIRSAGPLLVGGVLFDPAGKTSRCFSLFEEGSDPFSTGGGGPGENLPVLP